MANPFTIDNVVCDVTEMDFEVKALNKAAQTFGSNDSLQIRVKPRPNDPNMSTQHIATLLDVTCCMRLATMLRSVAICWELLAQV